MKKSIVCAAHLLTALIFFTAVAFTPAQQSTEINVTNIRSSKGNIILQIYRNEAEFKAEKPFKTMSFPKKDVTSGSLNVHVAIDPGVYGLTLVDDENENGKIDKNFIGMPKEGFGFSNFYLEKNKRPEFEQFKVDLKTTSKIAMKVKYM